MMGTFFLNLQLSVIYHYVSNVGSSGGAGSQGSLGGRGGGIIVLNINHTLDIEGTIRANGDRWIGSFAGGGSGGSILIKTGKLEGTGIVQVCRVFDVFLKPPTKFSK